MEIPEIVNLWAPISKIDEEKRMVFGYATTPTKDSQEEVVDLEASFEAVDEWKKWANIKEMHRAETAVGIAPIIEKHVGVGVYIGAEIVDDQAWRKCQKKVYKGFSIGGRVIEKEGNKIKKYRLLEVSLVDRPANPDAVFMVAKRDDTDASATEAQGGVSVEKTETVSNPVAGEATGTPPVAVTEAPVTKQEEKIEAKPLEKPPEETVTMTKAEFEKLQSQLKDLEMKKKLEDMAQEAILKAVEKLEPKIKKAYEEVKPKTDEEKRAEEAEMMRKMSVGELTAAMLKRATSSEE